MKSEFDFLFLYTILIENARIRDVILVMLHQLLQRCSWLKDNDILGSSRGLMNFAGESFSLFTIVREQIMRNGNLL